MTVKCSMCGLLIQRKPNQVRKQHNCFCSRACKDAYERKGTEVACTWCGESVYKPPSLRTTRNFCSQTCRLKWLCKNNVENLNVPGHSYGHKAPHLTHLNRLRNPATRLHCNTQYIASTVYRRIVEQNIGRILLPTEVVHHINGDRTDNRIENLMVMSKSEHHQLHMKIAVERFKGGE